MVVATDKCVAVGWDEQLGVWRVRQKCWDAGLWNRVGGRPIWLWAWGGMGGDVGSCVLGRLDVIVSLF